MTRSVPIAALLLVFASWSFPTGLASQPDDGAKKSLITPQPLLPPEGFDDGHGYVLPGTEWKQVSPESEGFSAARLEVLRALLKTHQTDAMMIVSRGKVVFEYGDVSLVSKIASVRKSVLDLMFAVEGLHGLDLNAAMKKNVVELGLRRSERPF